MIEENTIKWRFPPSGGGQQSGFNDGAIDHFKGHRLSSLVREVIQNSLDAGNNRGKPVNVHFSIFELNKSDCPEATELKEHLSACRDVAERQSLNEVVSYYDNAINKIEREKSIRFLTISDWNTTGLEGPITEPFGAWYALVKGSGVTQKPDGSLGSFGHGSKAPFSLSNIRSIFYLSKIKDGDNFQVRFQGKSILQSHIDKKDGQPTQGTGYFGWSANCAPLCNEQVPKWATRMRESCTDGTGTTICIPYYNLNLSEEPETIITVIANFFYAIKNHKLEVTVGDEVHLNASNIEEKYHEYFDLLETEKDEIDEQRIRQNLESIGAIVNCTQSGTQEVNGLGTFQWYLRVTDEITQKRVAVARQNGMLIRHNPFQLQRFQLTKNFEMFVCVDGINGSNLLKRLENPNHDDFEFDRIEDKEQRREAFKGYSRLMKKVREIIDRYAKIELEDEMIDDTLDDLFRTISENEKSGDSEERSHKIFVERGAIAKPKKPSKWPKHGDGDPFMVGGTGHRGGDGTKRTEGGPIPGKGKARVMGPARPSASTKKEKSLQNLRIAPQVPGSQEFELFFDNPGNGEYDLRVYKVGEDSNEPVRIKGIDGSYSDAVLIKFGDDERMSVKLQTDAFVNDFALEARIVTESNDFDEIEK